MKKLPTEWLPDTFAASTFYNGLSAILAGIVANTVTEGLSYGPTAPFLVSAACFAGCLLVVTFTWGENFGDQKADLIGAYKVFLNVILYFECVIRSYTLLPYLNRTDTDIS